MAKGAEERYLEWLEREEEAVGLTSVIGASTDIEAARALLYEELGYEPTDAQLDAFMGAGRMKYEVLPDAGVSFGRVEQVWGMQSVYRDIKTGRFVSRTFVEEALAKLGF